MWVFELPTTGSVSFSEFVSGGEPGKITSTTSARAALKTLLKASKRSDGERDYLNIVKAIDEYLPWLYALIAGVDSGALTLTTKPVFSWRSTLGSRILSSSPRVPVASLHGELACTLLTYALALANLAHARVLPLGAYEHERATSTAQRVAGDAAVNAAVQQLCRAAGVFEHLAAVVLPEWDRRIPGSARGRPTDLASDTLNGLAAFAMADVHVLALRRMFSKASAEAAFAPGPPLPASHPTVSLVSKLQLHIQATLGTAASFLRSADAHGDLRRAVERGGALHGALAHKWLGVDAGEPTKERGPRSGEAVAWLRWAKDELDGLRKASVGELVSRVGEGKEREAGVKSAKAALAREIESVNAFLKSYTQLNDTVQFEPVPPLSSLKALIPAGRSLMNAKEFVPPPLAYQPTPVSAEPANSNATAAGSGSGGSDATEANPAADKPRAGNYALAGAYF